MKKVLNICLIIVLLFALTGCSTDENANMTTTSSKNTTSSTENTTTNENQEETSIEDIDFKAAAEKQMALPNEGDTVAIFKIKDYGEIKVKFFEDVAPKAVENFTTHAKDGYYDGLTFHRVINEFMIQGGDPEGNGTGGESIWGDGFGPEISAELVPYRGSLCMAMSSLPNSIGSQFFITQAHYDKEQETLMNNYYPDEYPEGLMEQYKTYGGYLSLYGVYTVFGQVYEGLDVLDKIAGVKTESVPMVVNGETVGTQDDKPVKDVVIETIEVTTYKPE